ncbi:PilZ domain-containing protein [Altererythrobacter lutimaris]|uniref:PilZ domain-containing protein n=1 Tax=Altererythrobacter lutimaris TaxID=2743979 RepID=A0A850H3Q2_9SPHN|nr:PilZ domain-containing protein [Altererythrobacter lutimaris]NVE93804.1 PilZ domain-containing protein [Altererythrobacter lutimaris]
MSAATQSATTQGDDQGIERRNQRRYAKRMHAHVRERGRSGHVVELFDVSAAGCTIDTSAMAGNFHAPVWLRVGDVSSLQAKLVWSNGQRGGLRFETELHEAVLERLVGANDDNIVNTQPPAEPYIPTTPEQTESRRDQIKSGYAGPSLLQRKKPIGKKPFESLIVRHVARNTDHRHEDRYPAELTSGPSHVTMKEFSAKLHDISPSGLGLSAETEKNIGDPVEVVFANCEAINGRVIWRQGKRFGVELDENAININEDDVGSQAE